MTKPRDVIYSKRPSETWISISAEAVLHRAAPVFFSLFMFLRTSLDFRRWTLHPSGQDEVPVLVDSEQIFLVGMCSMALMFSSVTESACAR